MTPMRENATSKLPGVKAWVSTSADSNAIGRSVSAACSRASASSVSEKSIPVTEPVGMMRRAISKVVVPVPQPRSSTRWPGAKQTASNTFSVSRANMASCGAL